MNDKTKKELWVLYEHAIGAYDLHLAFEILVQIKEINLGKR